MLHARFAYFSALLVSSKSASLGEMHAMSTVSELPPSESWMRRVSLEVRYGMWP